MDVALDSCASFRFGKLSDSAKKIVAFSSTEREDSWATRFESINVSVELEDINVSSSSSSESSNSSIIDVIITGLLRLGAVVFGVVSTSVVPFAFSAKPEVNTAIFSTSR
jgi:hypothetical protein